MRVSIGYLPDSDDGVYQFIGTLTRVARTQSLFPIVRFTAQNLVRGLDPRNAEGQAASIRHWISSHIAFLRDPNGAELVQAPDFLLTELSKNDTVYGDCDDVATLAAALGLSIGLQARFILAGFQGQSGPFSHIWTELRSPYGGPWWEIDTTRPDQSFVMSSINRAKDFPI